MKYTNRSAKKSGNWSRAMRSVRQTEADYAGTGGRKDFPKGIVFSSEINSEK